MLIYQHGNFYHKKCVISIPFYHKKCVISLPLETRLPHLTKAHDNTEMDI